MRRVQAQLWLASATRSLSSAGDLGGSSVTSPWLVALSVRPCWGLDRRGRLSRPEGDIDVESMQSVAVVGTRSLVKSVGAVREVAPLFVPMECLGHSLIRRRSCTVCQGEQCRSRHRALKPVH